MSESEALLNVVQDRRSVRLELATIALITFAVGVVEKLR